MSLHIRIAQSQSQQPPTLPLYRLAWDDENPDYGYKCRTQSGSWSGPDNPPAVMRYYPEQREQSGDYRVNLAIPYDWKPAIIALNDGDVQKFDYLVGRWRALYNQTGWPKQAYISMSGNVLQGYSVGGWLRFQTLRPSDLFKVRGMTIKTHSQFVHRFTCVTWDAKTKTTKHIESTGTPRGQVYFYLVTVEGFAYIPLRHVVRL